MLDNLKKSPLVLVIMPIIFYYILECFSNNWISHCRCGQFGIRCPLHQHPFRLPRWFEVQSREPPEQLAGRWLPATAATGHRQLGTLLAILAQPRHARDQGVVTISSKWNPSFFVMDCSLLLLKILRYMKSSSQMTMRLNWLLFVTGFFL